VRGKPHQSRIHTCGPFAACISRFLPATEKFLRIVTPPAFKKTENYIPFTEIYNHRSPELSKDFRNQVAPSGSHGSSLPIYQSLQDTYPSNIGFGQAFFISLIVF